MKIPQLRTKNAWNVYYWVHLVHNIHIGWHNWPFCHRGRFHLAYIWYSTTRGLRVQAKRPGWLKRAKICDHLAGHSNQRRELTIPPVFTNVATRRDYFPHDQLLSAYTIRNTWHLRRFSMLDSHQKRSYFKSQRIKQPILNGTLRYIKCVTPSIWTSPHLL